MIIVTSTDYGHFFEGAEKRLVIYFSANKAASTAASVPPDLRTISQSVWEEVLEMVKCKILHSISSSEMIAYLLSESSMFISRNHLLLKTCGQTTLLLCLPKLLQIASKLGLKLVDMYYSHKNLLIPEAQSIPHVNFDQECQFLDCKLPSAGVKNTFSARNLSSDSFFLYSYSNSHFDRKSCKNEHLKFEIIMENLNETIMRQFIFNDKPETTANKVTVSSGISDLIPGMQIDDYIFDGCGYSMNGLSGSNYLTIHITPEEAFSFVSLETNVPVENYGSFIQKILECFKPSKFMVNLMIAKSEKLQKSESIFKNIATVKLNGFNRLELTMTSVNFINVIYTRYTSAKWLFCSILLYKKSLFLLFLLNYFTIS